MSQDSNNIYMKSTRIFKFELHQRNQNSTKMFQATVSYVLSILVFVFLFVWNEIIKYL